MAAYPRAKTAVTFIVCALVVTGVAAYVYGGIFASADTEKISDVTVASASSSNLDTLIETADWKDTFLNVTDDKSYQTTGAKNVSPDPTEEKLTATDLFGREFFSKFMTLRQAGMISNTEATDALVSQVLESSDIITDSPKVYSIADIRVTSIESNETREAYANAVAQTLLDNQTSEHEAIIAKEALETENPERLADIDPIIQAYATVRSELLKTPAPFSVAEYHLDLVNGISEALANAVALRNVMADPLQAVSAVSNYQSTESEVFYTVVDMRSYFNSYGIVFTPDEDAYRVFSMK